MIALSLLAAAAHAAPLQLTSSELTLTVDSETGDFLALAEKESGFDYLPDTAAPCFQLQLTDGDAAQQWKDSRSAPAVESDLTRDGPEQTLTLAFADVIEGIDALVTATAHRDKPELRLRIDIENDSGLILEQVIFPTLRLQRTIGLTHDDDRLFVPGGDGYVATAECLERQPWQRRQYPGSASMQFVAYYDSSHGLSVICEDTEGNPKLLGAGMQEDIADLATWFQRPFVPGEDFAGPWFSLRRCSGSWLSAAQHYREWAREQWWAQPKVGESAPPQWIVDSPLVLSAQFRPLGSGEWFVPLDRWAEFGELWKEATGAGSVMIESRYWEHSGVYTSPNDFPLYPSPEVVADTLSSVQEHGIHTQAMVAGMRWMIHREPFHTPHYNILGFEGREQFEKEGRAVCAVGRDGEVTEKDAYFTWDGDSAQICPATEFAREHFRNTARVLADAGFDLFEFDQMNGGAAPMCYSNDHDHPPGAGRWQHESIAELMRITREEGRKHNPAFGLSMEDPGELCLPYLDTYISRTNHVVNWPASGEGSEVVPAFFHVYHPVMPTTNVDIYHTSRPDDFVLLRTARAFITGAGLSTQLMPWQIQQDYGASGEALFPTPEKMDRDQLTLLANCVKTQQGAGRKYLVHGEMLRVKPLDVPTVSYSTMLHKGTENEEVSVEAPAVLHSAWALPDGRVAFFFVNPTHDIVPFPLSPVTEEWSAALDARAGVFINGPQGGTVVIGDTKELRVGALQTVMLEYER